MSAEMPGKWADDRLAIAAHAAHRGVLGAADALAGWNGLSARQRVNWRAAADAVRMMLDVPAPGPAAAKLVPESELADAERMIGRYRELLDEIGVMAANAPEDGDSFGLLEEIAMRIGAVDVPDSTPLDEWPDPENAITGRTPGASAPELAAAMAETRHYRDGITQLLADITTSADATRPSRKTQLEDEFAIALRKLQET